ncbi:MULTISPECIES: cyclodeaminase/cyclohydrolase family protein [Tissierellales]|jgi:formiminotetrahydrofolate cyclodeaminase|uniref:Sugar ABC transporter substrate-binding protein n=1 Tax=Acidilutibacter cellobiosedens TaxID=2507161 RepID=A0A410QEQ4_9FIRM|nr:MULTISPECIES: cyclodeaminase/cyclohydrolase family protein [Tissierellales]MBE6081653.1 cyclodeaminase/cyclohydrolase family protein [Tissierellaceae bacterium]QAT62457.1 sugar ABC transporter substrate-binding protein [Acidilutibacter cellobiosedens]SCL89016.1 Methenyltetrahydrofolate cyclohydrolase [Sporanaerobacter sp. PP17-6a]
MNLTDKSCVEFTEILASKSPVPGGGAASALVGAVGTALGSMVCNLTIGKKKYAEFEGKLNDILSRAEKLQEDLMKMVNEDAKYFLPLSKAYSMPKDTEEQIISKEQALQRGLKDACKIPVSIIELSYESIKIHEDLVDNCSKLAISDVGVGVQCLKAAIIGAELNVMINIKLIKDEDYINKIKDKIEPLVKDGIKICDDVYNKVLKSIL